jgi:8-oxo-dGTP diphosphatase
VGNGGRLVAAPPAEKGTAGIDDATLIFPLQGGRILLGLKKRGFGNGRWGGFGGKIEAGETVIASAVRELYEEAGLKAAKSDLRYMGRLTFLFPYKPAWDQVVHVFLVEQWLGEAAESEEMQPAWFAPAEIPYRQMWQDGRYWLPIVLDGGCIQATFTFQADNESVAEATVKIVLPAELRSCLGRHDVAEHKEEVAQAAGDDEEVPDFVVAENAGPGVGALAVVDDVTGRKN